MQIYDYLPIPANNRYAFPKIGTINRKLFFGGGSRFDNIQANNYLPPMCR